MTEILCRWLNSELNVSDEVDNKNFAEKFSTGYLIGEVLKQYGLQEDFQSFSQSRTADSKLNNFTRLEPTLHLLDVPFDTNTAHGVMQEKPGVATRLMYQLYIALSNKKQSNLTGVAIETMRPQAPVKLESLERGPYKERLKVLTPRQTDLNLDQLVERFRDRKKLHLDVEFRTRYEEEEKRRQWQQDQRLQELQKASDARRRQTELVARIKAATVQMPKPPPNKTLRAITARRDTALKREASEVRRQIDDFENQLNRSLTANRDDRDADEEVASYLQEQKEKEKNKPELVQLIRPAANDQYINKIRKRLQEDATARQEREKRRRKVLVDQLRAHDAQEEARREELLVNRLMRQSQQERRIATQLLQLRHEKAVICQNRIYREQQYEQRRQKDFQEALDREAELARLAKLEYIEQTQKDWELHNRIAKERAEAKYRKRYDICRGILLDLVDFACKVGKYQELTEKQLPAKLIREWKLLFTSGKPLYEPTIEPPTEEPGITAEDQLIEKERQSLLDEGDFLEYKNMVGEWQPPVDCDITGPQKNNAVLGHILARIFGIVSPPTPPPAAPEIPLFPVKACFLGKAFTGKSTVARTLAEEHGLAVLDVDELVREAVDAYKAGEVMETTPAPPRGEPLEGADGNTQPPVTVSSEEIPSGVPDTPGEVDDKKSELSIKESGDVSLEEIPKETESSEGKPASSKKPPSPTKKKGPPKPEATPRAKLGRLTSKFLRKGQPVKDELLVEVMVEAVKRTLGEHGWIMDGFPSTVAQAKLLEKALSGYDAAAATKPSKSKANRQSRLAVDPNPPKEVPPPVSGIDLVVLMDAPDEVVLRRAAGRTYVSQTGEQYQQEYKPPPEGSCTGVGKQEKVAPVKDPAHDQEQIQHRLTSFQDSRKKLEKWFNGFGNLRRVDVSMDKEDAYAAVRDIMVEVKEKIEKTQEDAERSEEDLLKAAIEGSTAATMSEVPTTQPTDTLDSLATQPGDSKVSDAVQSDAGKETAAAVPSGSPKGSRAGSAKRSGSAKRGSSPKQGGSSPKREKSPKGKRDREKKKEGSRSGSAAGRSSSAGKGKRGKSGSPKRGKSGRKSPKREPTPEPEPEPEPPVPSGPPPPQPGSEDWVYVDEPIDEALACVIAPHWENTEATYVASTKHIFRNVRTEREGIYHYLYGSRRDFEEYLRRPDGKQEYLAAWQLEYNEVAEDMRDDEETRAELHQRVQDLKEQLWAMSDNRKVDAETERTSVMEEGWLEDRLGLLTNHYLTLMQSEVDRYQDTLRLLKDYYQGMEGKIPEEFHSSFIRIPLIDLSTAASPPAERPGSAPASAAAVASESVARAVTPTTPSAKGKKGKEQPQPQQPPPESKEDTEEDKPKIPLVPRRPTSTEGFFPSQTPAGKAEKGSKSRAAKEKKEKAAPAASLEETQESPLPPTDADEKLISDAFQFGMMKISEMTAAELAARDAEDEAEKLREAEKDKEKDKGNAKKPAKKRSKSKSPTGRKSPSGKKSPPVGKKSPMGKKSPKKGKKTATPTPPATPPPETEDTPEERAKKELRERMKQEYLAAISHEEGGLKVRMELTKIHAIAVLQELKMKAEEVYRDMDNWLGERFQREMQSIDSLAEVLCERIEKRERIKPELVSFQDDLIINREVKVFRTPSPQPRPSPVELGLHDYFTVDQLRPLLHQFIRSAPSGFISNRGFVDTLSDLTALTHGTEALPDSWMALNINQLEHLSTILSPDSEYVDWRTFVLQLANPWPQPSQAQLLQALERFREIDNQGMVTREQFHMVPLWYTADARPPTPDDPGKPLAFDRTGHVQALFFDIFADQSTEPPNLDYTNMLLYFSIDQDALNGFFRALSVASGQHMPRPQIEEALPREKQLDQLNYIKEVVEVLTGSEIKLPEKRIEPSLGPPEEDIPTSALHAKVTLEALVQVLHHGQPTLGDSHRFSVTSDPEDTFSKERLASVYRELGDDNDERLGPVPFFTLMDHPIIQDCLSLCHRYRTPDLRPVFAAAAAATTVTSVLVDNDVTSNMS